MLASDEPVADGRLGVALGPFGVAERFVGVGVELDEVHRAELTVSGDDKAWAWVSTIVEHVDGHAVVVPVLGHAQATKENARFDVGNARFDVAVGESDRNTKVGWRSSTLRRRVRARSFGVAFEVWAVSP